jgi:hypothetical protein
MLKQRAASGRACASATLRAMSDRTLTLRELNRATLARQLLLERHDLSPVAALERVAGLQSQAHAPPFIGLWTRLRDFDERDLQAAIDRHEVVRATMMRHTVHMVSAADYVRFREVIQPALERSFGGSTRKRVGEGQVAAAVDAARERLADGPQTFAQIRALIQELLPDSDHAALSYGVRTHVRLIAVPKDVRWRFGGTAPFALAEDWLGQALPDDSDPRELILRYLAAFGPATLPDIQMWSGLAGLRPAVDALRPELRTFSDQRGRELFDVPGAPLPGGDTPAPLRFLPEFDNTLLAHSDRTRVIADEHRPRVYFQAGRVIGTFLLDGFVSGSWKLQRAKSAATLVLEPFRKLTKAERAALAADEADALIRFAEPDAEVRDVRIEVPA